MARLDLSRLSGEELDRLYNGRHVLNDDQRLAVEAEWNARKGSVGWDGAPSRSSGPRHPDNVESDLDAAATPITPDPVVKPKAKPKAEAKSGSAPAKPKPESKASLEARGETGGGGLLPGESLDEYGQKYRASLAAEREAAMAQAKPYREGNVSPDADQAEYDSATGLLGDSSLPPMDGYNEVTGEYTTPRQPLHPMIARDRALEAQHHQSVADNIREKYGPENEQIYWDGVRRGVVDMRAVQTPAEKAHNAKWEEIERQTRFAPTEEGRQAARAQMSARDTRTRENENYVEREIVRWSEATGLPPGQVRAMLSAGIKPDMTPEQMEKARSDDRAALRDRANANRADRRQAAKDHWRAVAMLAGGSQNINSGNRAFYNQLAMLPEEERQRQLQYALPGGRERAAVEAAHNQQLSELGLRVAMGQGFQPMNPAQEAAANQQIRERQAEQSAVILSDAQSFVNESADDQGWFNLATRLIGGGAEGWDNTLLTIEEENAAARKLMAKYPHLTFEQALEYVNAAAGNKTRQQRPAPQAG
jgi:hypothetical protein